jgi:hypothetical protein
MDTIDLDIRALSVLTASAAFPPGKAHFKSFLLAKPRRI